MAREEVGAKSGLGAKYFAADKKTPGILGRHERPDMPGVFTPLAGRILIFFNTFPPGPSGSESH